MITTYTIARWAVCPNCDKPYQYIGDWPDRDLTICSCANALEQMADRAIDHVVRMLHDRATSAGREHPPRG